VIEVFLLRVVVWGV